MHLFVGEGGGGVLRSLSMGGFLWTFALHKDMKVGNPIYSN